MLTVVVAVVTVGVWLGVGLGDVVDGVGLGEVVDGLGVVVDGDADGLLVDVDGDGLGDEVEGLGDVGQFMRTVHKGSGCAIAS
jgi:hypothetical protein